MIRRPTLLVGLTLPFFVAVAGTAFAAPLAFTDRF